MKSPLLLASIMAGAFVSFPGRSSLSFRCCAATPEQAKEIIDRLNHFKRQGSRAWRWKGARR